MNIVLLVNPKSGRGRAQAVALRTASALEDHGHAVAVNQIGSPVEPTPGADLLIIVGGDGTVHHLLPLVARLRIPVWQIPTGTENLFARNFGMSISTEVLVRAVSHMTTTRIDLAEYCLLSPQAGAPTVATSNTPSTSAPRSFVLMLSLGPDAGVVHRLAASRKGAITHLSYLTPIAQELSAPSLTSLSVEVDGRSLVTNRCGWLVVANSREYGMRVNPCPTASMSDGLLDIAFFPASNAIRAATWMLRSRMSRHRAPCTPIHARGRNVQVQCDHRSLPIQVDGEPAGLLTPGQRLQVSVVPDALRVVLGNV